jgi:hypothetical protein
VHIEHADLSPSGGDNLARARRNLAHGGNNVARHYAPALLCGFKLFLQSRL